MWYLIWWFPKTKFLFKKIFFIETQNDDTTEHTKTIILTFIHVKGKNLLMGWINKRSNLNFMGVFFCLISLLFMGQSKLLFNTNEIWLFSVSILPFHLSNTHWFRSDEILCLQIYTIKMLISFDKWSYIELFSFNVSVMILYRTIFLQCFSTKW